MTARQTTTHYMYGGEIEMLYNDELHQYTVDGEVVPGVSSVLSVINKPFLLPWAVKMCSEHIRDSVRNFRDEHGRSMSPDEFDQICLDGKKAHKAVSKEATDIGSMVHDWIEAWINAQISGGDEPAMPDEEFDKARKGIDQFLKWTEGHEIEWVASEKKIMSRERFYAGTLDIKAYIDGKYTLADIKALPLDTPLITPSGWTTMGEVSVGDRVIGSDGKPTRVVSKSPVYERRLFRIEFDTGEVIEADADHRWTVWTTEEQKGPKIRKVMTTQEILDHKHRVWIHNSEPLQLPEADLPIDPYLFGFWLGDGTKSDGKITFGRRDEDEQVARLRRMGHELSEPHGSDPDKASTRTVYGLRTQLREAGILGSKQIPEVYLRASHVQRLSLLRGLMDADGTWHKSRGEAVFYTTCRDIALQVEELIRSLGENPSLLPYKYSGFGKKGTAYRLVWKPVHANPFHLSFKASQCKPTGTGNYRLKNWKRGVRSVTDIGVSARVQCIEVDNEDSMYLAGKNLIPTHNTSKRIYPEYYIQTGAYVQAEEEESGEKFDQTLIIQVPKTGGRFKTGGRDTRTEIEKDINAFNSALDIYNWKKING